MSYTDPQIGTLTITGDPARFVATERVPVSGLSMDFEPVQDLHGYEYPWPAGGGKNLAPPVTGGESNGVTCTVNSDGSVNLNGTATGDARFVSEKFTLKAGTYKSNGVPQGGLNNYVLYLDGVIGSANIGGEITITVSSDVVTRAVVQVYNGGTANNITMYPMIRLSTVTDSTYQPYSNICPIYGYDSVNVYVSPEPAVVDGTEKYEIEFGQTVYAGTLTINEDGSGTIVATWAKDNMEDLTWFYQPSNTRFLTTDLVDRIKKPAANNDLAPLMSSMYKNVILANLNNACITCVSSGNTFLKDERFTDVNSFIAAVTGQQLVYELAEPITLQLDPIEITTLIGLNYVWTDEHNLITISFPYNKEVQPMSLTYEHCWTYPKAYIDKLEARIAALETAAEAAAAEANTAAAPANTRETVAEEITVTKEPETEPVTKKGGK